MKSKISSNKERKFGNDLQNKENTKNSQENKINESNNYPHGKENIKILKKNSFLKPKKINMKLTFHKKDFFLNQNPQYVEEYTPDIIKHILLTEKLNILDYSKENIFHLQDKYINEEKRKNIIELLFYYNFRWKLNPDSIYLAINILDRYTNKIKIKKNEYELAAIAAFLIGSKYEDIFSPNAKCLSYIYSFKYNPDEILEKESEILSTLDYSLLYNSSFKILQLLYHLSGIKNENVYYFSELALEISLTDLSIMAYSQKKRAIAVFLLAKKLFGIKSGNYKILFFFDYIEDEILSIQSKIFTHLRNAVCTAQQNLIVEKFRSQKYSSIFSVFEKKVMEKMKNKEAMKELTKTEKKKRNL